MTKAEVLNALTTTGQIGTFQATDNWRTAFQLYNAEKKERLNPNCSTCFKKVRAWLQG